MFIGDADVRRCLTFPRAIAAMEAAFRDHGRGITRIQERVRSFTGSSSLSMMGAILPDAGVMGAKIYPTVGGRFNFVMALFSTEDGRLLAMMDGNALTEFRTAAVTAVAVRHLARQSPKILTVFGTGLQARAHLEALLCEGTFSEARIVGRNVDAAEDLAAWTADRFGMAARAAQTLDGLRGADVVVTATRAKEPLFPGKAVEPGALVAAIGSSKPDAREIDAALLVRASRIVVEWIPQARREAGDLIRASDAIDWEQVEELGPLVAATAPSRVGEGITVFKSVGVGLSDVALCDLVYRAMDRGEAC